jgi:hypothetical protein
VPNHSSNISSDNNNNNTTTIIGSILNQSEYIFSMYLTDMSCIMRNVKILMVLWF